MKPKVVWTTLEWRQIADWFARNGVNPDDRGFTANLDVAQKVVLTVDRQRTIVGLPKEVRQRIKAELGIVVPKDPPPVTISPPAAPSTKDLSTEELLVELARRAARAFASAERNDLESCAAAVFQRYFDKHAADRAFHPAPKHDPNPVQEVKTPRKKVLVIGPNNDAGKFLTEEFPNLALRFVNKDDPPSRITDLAPCCEVIVAVTKFCSHKQTETMKAQNKTPWALVTSTQELREWLRKWL